MATSTATVVTSTEIDANGVYRWPAQAGHFRYARCANLRRSNGEVESMQDVSMQGMQQPLAPVGARERIEVMDVLRGFALLGILLMNIEAFVGR